MYKNIETKLEKISESPLFYMFSSSKELFHSNLWFWLTFKNKKQVATLFSKDINIVTGNIEVERECNFKTGDYQSKVDLVFFENNEQGPKKKQKLIPICVIENKIKDYPTNEQLIRIQKSVNNKNIEYLLVTLIPMDNQQLPGGWKQITYDELANRMSCTKFEYSDSFNNELINKYIEFIENLSEVANMFPNSDNYDFAKKFDEKLFEILDKVKLWELYSKWRASKFSIFIFNELKNRKNIIIPILYEKTKNENAPYVYIDYGINHQKATITCRVVISSILEVGVQIEDNQYRRFLVMEKNKVEKNINRFIRNNFWLNDNFKGKPHRKGEEPPSTLRYDGKNSNLCFRYQYTIIDIKKNSFISLIDKINEDLLFIIKNIEEFKRLNS